jgi:pentatricopeptide repeat protein
VAEKVLTEVSFQTNISYYSRLIDMYAKENRIGDTETMLEKMNENGIQPDASIASVLVHMYSKIGNLE